MGNNVTADDLLADTLTELRSLLRMTGGDFERCADVIYYAYCKGFADGGTTELSRSFPNPPYPQWVTPNLKMVMDVLAGRGE